MPNDQFRDAVSNTLYALNMLEIPSHEQIGVLVIALNEILLKYAEYNPAVGKVIASNVTKISTETERLIHDNL